MQKLSYKENAIRWVWLAILIVILDQVTKFIAVVSLTLNQPAPVLPFFNLTLMRNTGAAFSFMAQHPGSGILFSVLAIVISVFIILWLLRLPKNKTWLAIALALILGGAIGNLIDRAHNGFVIDFIQLYYHQWYWPAFNIADSAITIGAIMLAIETFFGRKDSQNVDNTQS